MFSHKHLSSNHVFASDNSLTDLFSGIESRGSVLKSFKEPKLTSFHSSRTQNKFDFTIEVLDYTPVKE